MVDDFYTAKLISQDKLKYQYEITVTADYCNVQLEDGFLEIMKTASFPGFRSGKVSIDLVKKKYWDNVVDDVVQKTLKHVSDLYIKSNFDVDNVILLDIRVVSNPYDSNNANNTNLVYVLCFEVMPEVPLLSVDNISLKDREVVLDDDNINQLADEMLKDKRVRFVAPEDESYAVKTGDQVLINYQGKLNGKNLKSCMGKGVKLEIGKGGGINGFEDQLIGMKKGDSKTFELRFPDDYHSKALASKNVMMFLKIEGIFTAQLISDIEEVVKKNGFESFANFLSFARDKLSEQVDEMKLALLKKDFFDFMDNSYEFDLPESILKKEEENIMRQLKESKVENINCDVIKEAKRRVKLGMLLMRVAKQDNISVDNQDISDFINYNYINRGVSVDNILKLLKVNQEFGMYVKGKALEDKVVNNILDKVKKEKEVMSLQELKELYKVI